MPAQRVRTEIFVLALCIAGCNPAGTTTGSSTGASTSTGATTGTSTSTSASTSASTPAGARSFPDTRSRIAIFADQLQNGMTPEQVRFAANHYVGTQKQELRDVQALRAVNPSFICLHYHLAMWQSAPGVDFIIDGSNWGNDYADVTTHESWFWHDTSGARVASSTDQKLLMNVADGGFRQYWQGSLTTQARAAEDDGIFLDSASPALLNGEAGADARLLGTAVHDTPFSELGGLTWSAAWEQWMASLDSGLAGSSLTLIPNVGQLVTSWDTTNYGVAAGLFLEDFGQPSFERADWKQEMDELVRFVGLNKIVILQAYLTSFGDVATRRYYLANYLLVKGDRTYVDYFANGALEWYPEWDLDLGLPLASATNGIDDLLQAGVYRREFQRGIVLVNPSASPVTVSLGGTFQRVVPQGGGPVDASGAAAAGSIATAPVSTIDLPAASAEILLR